MSLIIAEDKEEFIKLLSEKFAVSKLEIANVFFLNGIDTFLCSTPSNLKYFDFSQLKKWVTRSQLDNEVAKLLELHKEEKEVDENEE